jgi:hypothetical protein
VAATSVSAVAMSGSIVNVFNTDGSTDCNDDNLSH